MLLLESFSWCGPDPEVPSVKGPPASTVWRRASVSLEGHLWTLKGRLPGGKDMGAQPATSGDSWLVGKVISRMLGVGGHASSGWLCEPGYPMK